MHRTLPWHHLLVWVFLAIAPLALCDGEPGVADSAVSGAVSVEFFHEPGCTVCRRVSEVVFPELRERLGARVRIVPADVSKEANYARLLAYQERLPSREKAQANASAVVVVDGRFLLGGWRDIRENLIPLVENLARSASSGDALQSIGVSDEEPVSMDELARGRFETFTLLGVAGAGLIDGLNPCAIATLVFLVSLLTALRVRGVRLLLVGGAFCLASFLVYLALGFSLLRVLHTFQGFETLQSALDVVVVGVLLVLAALSFRDAVRYHRSGESDSVSVKLPAGIVRRIRSILRRRLRSSHLVVGAFAAGAAVTALESVCTGQVYVPVLVFLVREDLSARALGYLLVYNALFLMPLVIAFLLAWRGMRTERLLQWSRRNVPASKALLGILLLVLALAIALL